MTATMNEAVTIYDFHGMTISVIAGPFPAVSFYNARRDEGGLLNASEARYMARSIAEQGHGKARESDGTRAAMRLFRLSAAFGHAAELLDPTAYGLTFWETIRANMAWDDQ